MYFVSLWNLPLQSEISNDYIYLISSAQFGLECDHTPAVEDRVSLPYNPCGGNIFFSKDATIRSTG